MSLAHLYGEEPVSLSDVLFGEVMAARSRLMKKIDEAIVEAFCAGHQAHELELVTVRDGMLGETRYKLTVYRRRVLAEFEVRSFLP